MKRRNFRGALIGTILLVMLLSFLWQLQTQIPPLSQWVATTSYEKPTGTVLLRSGEIDVPFCFQLRADTQVQRAAGCEEQKRFSKPMPVCGWQNLDEVAWHPEVVDLAVDPLAKKMLAAATLVGCKTFVIDIESVVEPRVASLTPWLVALVASLKRESPTLQVSIPVYAKENEKGAWAAPAAQNWKALCSVADEILIMAYDYRTPGPGSEFSEVAPQAWVERTLKYALTQCAPARIRLGLAAFGYNWHSGAVVSEREYVSRVDLQHDPVVQVETESLRKNKIDFAVKLGIRKVFTWTAVMRADTKVN